MGDPEANVENDVLKTEQDLQVSSFLKISNHFIICDMIDYFVIFADINICVITNTLHIYLTFSFGSLDRWAEDLVVM